MATICVAVALAALLWRLAKAYLRDMKSGCCAAGGCGCGCGCGCGGGCGAYHGCAKELK